MKADQCEHIEFNESKLEFSIRDFIFVITIIASMAFSWAIMPQNIMAEVDKRYFTKELGVRLESRMEKMDLKIDKLLERVK